MQLIEMDCPTCGTPLSLDAGFAGGVCRCSGCGTLMTVPRGAHGRGRSEKKIRPEAPAGRPSSSATVPETLPREVPVATAEGIPGAASSGKWNPGTRAVVGIAAGVAIVAGAVAWYWLG